MNKYRNYIVGFVCLASLLPFVASADTVGDLQNQIKALMSQIQVLQDQIHTIRQASSTSDHASTTPMIERDDREGQGEGKKGNGEGGDRRLCVPLMRNIGVGSHGDDVKAVQKILAMDPSVYSGTTTGYFGPQTAKAMMKFQMKFGIASSTDGSVGSATRQFFDKQCPQPPVPQMELNGGIRGGEMMGSSTMVRPPREMVRPEGEGDGVRMNGSTTPPRRLTPEQLLRAERSN